MSAETLESLERAIHAHFADTAEAGAMVSAWVVAVECQTFEVDESGELDPVRYTNDYATSASSPNTLASVAAWASGQIMESIGDADD